MGKTNQIPLDLPHRASLERDNFLITGSNAHAVTWVDQWPNWPAPVLIIYGPPASGKTHLSCVWAQQTSAVCLDLQNYPSIDPESVLEDTKAIILDDVDAYLSNAESETFLFHLYNLAKEKNAHLMMTMTSSPNYIDFKLPDLRSRLCAAPSVAIEPPSDEELMTILVKMFADRQIQISMDVLNYIMPRIERSYDVARTLVERADSLSLAEKNKITIPLIKRVIEADIID